MLVSSLSVWPRLAYPSWISLWTTESRTLCLPRRDLDQHWDTLEIYFQTTAELLFILTYRDIFLYSLLYNYRFDKAISVLPDTFLPQSWSRLELAWSSAWWRRPPPPLACWCRCHPSRSNGCPGCPPADRTGVFVFVFLCDILQVTCGWWHWST